MQGKTLQATSTKCKHAHMINAAQVKSNKIDREQSLYMYKCEDALV